MKGDAVSILYMAGDNVREYSLTVDKNGRTLVVEEPGPKDTWFVVKELTRGGTIARSMRLRAADVITFETNFGEE